MNDNPAYVCKGLLLLMLILFLCAGYAYRVNTLRPADDPKKHNYHLGAVILAPFTWLLFFFASITIFILRVLMYTIFLIVFLVAFLAVRKPFLLVWLDKIATKVGNKLLEANTFLIKMAFSKKTENHQAP